MFLMKLSHSNENFWQSDQNVRNVADYTISVSMYVLKKDVQIAINAFDGYY